MNSKEHGEYISSTPSSAARKAVTKLCADNKNKKVEFCMRETTQGSNKKIYGPYLGEMKKLDKPIELKGRVIQYSVNVHLKKKNSTTKTAKKVGNKLRGGMIEEDGMFESSDFIFVHISKSSNINQPIHEMPYFKMKNKKKIFGKDQPCFFLIPVKINDNEIYYRYAVYYSDDGKKLVIKEYNNDDKTIKDINFTQIPKDDDGNLFFEIMNHIINKQKSTIPDEFRQNQNYIKELENRGFTPEILNTYPFTSKIKHPGNLLDN
jgi:hypothetical protein